MERLKNYTMPIIVEEEIELEDIIAESPGGGIGDNIGDPDTDID